ncbi:DMT family transporter [Acidothermaceae bacterium B102]|nr:DMT family transporter [Acidothermaceae bacterium B102]
MKWAAVAVALASAFAYSVASVTQHREAGSVSTHEVGAPSLLLKLAVRPWWLVGALADVFGVAFQTLALGWGSVVLVQPVLVTGVAMAVVLAAATQHEWPHPRELALAIGCAASLGVLLVVLDETGGRQHVRFLHFAPYGLTVIALGLACALAARRFPGASAGWLGAAAGLMVGASSVLLKVCAGQLSHSVADLLRHWHVYGFLAFGGAALVLSQNAFQAGRMAPGIASLSVVEPVVAIAIAVPLLREHLSVSPWRVTVDVIAALVAAYCVVGLANATEQRAHAPAIAGAGDRDG